ncbi:MAG: DUF6386 family protein [Planctomycetota bacterium]
MMASDPLIADEFRFATDTATMCVFDLAALRHRLSDAPDWWIEPEDMEAERGRALFVELGSDGVYAVRLLSHVKFEAQGRTLIECPSGRVFVGAGEEVTSGGIEPSAIRGGRFVELAVGAYWVSYAQEGYEITIAFETHR